ncbi:MAG: AgmX/PglI C-terminal domain-containing protein, partial [Myxococcota bacterium]
VENTPRADERELRASLGEAQEKLDALVRDLHAVDAELEGLAPERRQFALLGTACDALAELDAEGAAGLFWGARSGESERTLEQARARLDGFAKRLFEIEERREAIVDALDQQGEHVEVAAFRLDEAERLEEERRNAWVIEREVEAFPVRAAIMPWTRGGDEDRRFRQLLSLTVLYSILLALLVPLVQLPLPEPWEPSEMPERLTRLIREARPLAPRPLVQPETVPEKIQPKPLEELTEPTENVAAVPQATAEEAAAAKGILAFRESFSGLATNQPSNRLGARARIRGTGDVASGQPQRSLVTSNAPGSSGGVKLAALSRGLGGGGGSLEGVEVGRVASSIGGSGSSSGVGGTDSKGRGGAVLGRTDEEIQIVFDRHKAALYRLYNRELRNDPTLRGQLVLRLTIDPDGSVSFCEIQAATLDAPELGAQVVTRVRGFDFGAKDVPAVTILYPIDFLPAT